MVTGCPHWLCPSLNDMYHVTAILILSKCLLIKRAQPKLIGKIKERTRYLISGSDTLTILRAHEESTHSTLSVRCQIVSHSLVFVSWSLLVRYEQVLGSLQILFHVVASSLDDHVRRIFQRMSENSRFFHSFAIR